MRFLRFLMAGIALLLASAGLGRAQGLLAPTPPMGWLCCPSGGPMPS